MTRILLASVALLAAAVPGPAMAAPTSCAAMIGGYISWMGGSPNKRIGAKFARVKITSGGIAPSTTKWGYIAESEGAFGWARDHMQGRFMVAFSDRSNFQGQRDITDISLWADGHGQIVLSSWGGGIIPISNVRCDSVGFLSAIEGEGNGTSMVTLSFRRETFGTPDMKD